MQHVDQSDSPARVAVAFAISRRLGGAVTRNRLRRRLRSLMGEVEDSLRDGSYLITAGFRATELSYDDLRDDLRRALRDAGVLP